MLSKQLFVLVNIFTSVVLLDITFFVCASRSPKSKRGELSHSQFQNYATNSTKHELAIKSRIGIFILSTSKGGGYFFRANAMGAHQTWGHTFPHVFYVMSDNPSARFAFRNCRLKLVEADAGSTKPSPGTKEGVHFDPPDPFLDKVLTAKCNNEPAVILTRACDDSYYGGKGPCCKLDVAITFALSKSAQKTWFGGEPLNWMLFMDDDNYLRVDGFLDLLHLYENTHVPVYHRAADNDNNHQQSVSTSNKVKATTSSKSSLISAREFASTYERMFDKSLMCVCKAPPRTLKDVQKMEQCDNCGEVFKHDNCREIAGGLPKFTQQLLFNRHGLEKARDAARSGAMRKICEKKSLGGFEVTHDAGIKILAWQLQLDVCSIPGCFATASWERVKERPTEDIMILHGAKERNGSPCDKHRFGDQVFLGGYGNTDFKDTRAEVLLQPLRRRRATLLSSSKNITTQEEEEKEIKYYKRKESAEVIHSMERPMKHRILEEGEEDDGDSMVRGTKITPTEHSKALHDMFAECKDIPHDIDTQWFDMYDVHEYFMDQPNLNLTKFNLMEQVSIKEDKELFAPQHHDQGGGKDGEQLLFLSPPVMPLFGYERTNHWKVRQKYGGLWAPFTPQDCRKPRR